MSYGDTAEAAWRWVLDQVRWDGGGPWIPESVPAPETLTYRDGMHSGIGSLGHALADIRLSRAWTDEERHLAGAVAERLRANIATERDCTFFDGLVGTIGVLTALGEPGADAAVARLHELATPDGWPQTALEPPRIRPGGRINDVVLGTAGVLLGALWARRAGNAGSPDTPGRSGAAGSTNAAGAVELAEHAAAVLLAELEPVPTGADWPFVPRRFRFDDGPRMPNFSHGVAGIAAALAIAGAELGRPDLTGAARRGAKHLVTLGVTDGHGFAVPQRIPAASDVDEIAYGWCHGTTGTSLLFRAIAHAGVDEIAGVPTETWHRRCLHAARTSGLPARRYPGFWDNDGRCCGTAGVGEVFLNTGNADDRTFALHLADTLVERAERHGPHAYWRFIEHRAPEPLLPPGVGWMQGAAGIAAFLFRAARVVRDGGQAATVPRMDTWWAQRPDASSSSSFR